MMPVLQGHGIVGAPSAATIIRVMDKIIPVDARAFDTSEEQAAWRFVGAEPVAASGA